MGSQKISGARRARCRRKSVRSVPPVEETTRRRRPSVGAASRACHRHRRTPPASTDRVRSTRGRACNRCRARRRSPLRRRAAVRPRWFARPWALPSPSSRCSVFGPCSTVDLRCPDALAGTPRITTQEMKDFEKQMIEDGKRSDLDVAAARLRHRRRAGVRRGVGRRAVAGEHGRDLQRIRRRHDLGGSDRGDRRHGERRARWPGVSVCPGHRSGDRGRRLYVA